MTDVWQVLVRSCEANVPGARTINFRNPGDLLSLTSPNGQIMVHWSTGLSVRTGVGGYIGKRTGVGGYIGKVGAQQSSALKKCKQIFY
jgi:hypothetical protein